MQKEKITCEVILPGYTVFAYSIKEMECIFVAQPQHYWELHYGMQFHHEQNLFKLFYSM